MNCILNHCSGHIATDIAVIIFYALAVSATITFALLSQSKSIQTAALMIAGVWLLSLFYFLSVGAPQYNFLIVLLDGALAYQFWRMSKAEIFPAALCCFMIANVAIVIVSTAISLSEFWTIFTLNRIFELTLAYIIGASIYRIRILKPPEFDERKASDGSLKFLVA